MPQKMLFLDAGDRYDVVHVPQTLMSIDSPGRLAPTFQVLGLQVCLIVPSMCGAREQTQGLVHAKQALY